MMRMRLLILAVICLGAGATVRPEETNAARGTGFSSFEIIPQRNIFNPNRSNRPPRSSRSSETERKPRIDSFTLLGTMSYEKGSFAFFEGSSPDYRKAVKARDTIAGYTIAKISSKEVQLETNGTTVSLPVGMQMKREDEGEWAVAAPSGSTGGDPVRSVSSKAGSSSPPSADESEVLKRLLKKREEEK